MEVASSLITGSIIETARLSHGVTADLKKTELPARRSSSRSKDKEKYQIRLSTTPDNHPNNRTLTKAESPT